MGASGRSAAPARVAASPSARRAVPIPALMSRVRHMSTAPVVNCGAGLQPAEEEAGCKPAPQYRPPLLVSFHDGDDADVDVLPARRLVAMGRQHVLAGFQGLL